MRIPPSNLMGGCGWLLEAGSPGAGALAAGSRTGAPAAGLVLMGLGTIPLCTQVSRVDQRMDRQGLH